MGKKVFNLTTGGIRAGQRKSPLFLLTFLIMDVPGISMLLKILRLTKTEGEVIPVIMIITAKGIRDYP